MPEITPNYREDFAPFWLAMVIIDDPKGGKFVEEFLNIADKQLNGSPGRFTVRNERTGSIYGVHEGPTRHSGVVTFLASIWTRRDHYNMALLRDNGEYQDIDTSFLRRQEQLESFSYAFKVGEEAHREEKERRSRLAWHSDPVPSGEYVQVWVPEGHRVYTGPEDE
jgi:hypothetical protein